MSRERFTSVLNSANRRPVTAERPKGKLSDYFGSDVFTLEKMQRYISPGAFVALTKCIEERLTIDRTTAEEVAEGMKEWSVERGVTHYTHWFQPLNDGTAEKHESFLDFDHRGNAFEHFSGKVLMQQEPDASSFPNGGLRNTFEARGYTAWDPSSPAFIIDDTLCIPTLFIAYTGEALDYKTPLLRSMEALSKAATHTAQYFLPNTKSVRTYLGWEQEYFLVDEELYTARPDLLLTGRTLMGHESAKNQQLDDHYFGAIPPRVQEFMKDLELAGLRLGIPLKARHNEVAPNQFELAPIYEECNIANDHNQLIMVLMNRLAPKHKFRVLMHEKPFSGVNGSGKHCNWSLGTDEGVNLIAPGKTAADNLRFICFMANVLKAVKSHNSLLKATIASATNVYRLGGHEAPPAIFSSFLGSQVSQLFRVFAESQENIAIAKDAQNRLALGVGYLPEILLDNTDRNRTSPFAFTGNRFEFRAVGSSANCAAPMLALNTAVAHQLMDFNEKVDQQVSDGQSLQEALFETLKGMMADVEAIHFDGNSYSDEWRVEAIERGLDVEMCVPRMISAYTSPSSVKAFERCGVMKQYELEARNEIKWELFTKKVQIESRVLGDLALNHILPVGIKYQNSLVANVEGMQRVFPEEYELYTSETMNTLRAVSNHIYEITRQVNEMTEARKRCNVITEQYDKAMAYDAEVRPYLESIRYHIDHLELLVDDTIWPMPKYRELLFTK